MASGRNSVTISVDTAGINGLLDQLGDDAEDAARPAAQAGIQVVYDEIKKNVSALGRKTGNLERSIYQAFSQSQSAKGIATYHASWNSSKAPHGWIVENGHLQRYRYYKNNQGEIRPMVRPGMDGRPKPSRRASQAEKDAYYVTLPTPIQVPAKAFVRRAQSAFGRAGDAVEAELLRRIAK